MSSSNMGVVTTGDVEAQRHNPNWFDAHEHMLRPNQECEANRLGYFILKLPECRRQPPQAFSPQGWRFGLHNRENLDSSGSEAVKLGIAVQYGLVGDKWVHFRDTIVDDIGSVLACYGLQIGVTSWTHEQIKHVLALDALFLADYFEGFFPQVNESRLWSRKLTPSWLSDNATFIARDGIWNSIVSTDLYRVENQIPYVLIDKVVEYINNFVPLTCECNEPLIVVLQYQQKRLEYVVATVTGSFMSTPGGAFKFVNSSSFGEETHLLGVAYKAMCGPEGLEMKSGMWRSVYLHVPSATKLEQSGIKILGVEGPLCRMSYSKKFLCIPKMVICDQTASFIQNVAWYELKSVEGGCLFNFYIFLIRDLIKAPEDLELLIKRGVIDNLCGTRGFEMWRAVGEGLELIPPYELHYNMKVDIMDRCDLRRYRLWSEFIVVFCSKPWLVLSTIVVVLVTVATLIQTYIAIIGSNKMKPKFP